MSSVEWNGSAYCITRPYSAKKNKPEDGGVEFPHCLGEVFNGLIAEAFSIEGSMNDRSSRKKGKKRNPEVGLIKRGM